MTNGVSGKQKKGEKPRMRFQKRDGVILQTIYVYGGVLARRHIKEMFWPDSSIRPMERRLSKLYHADYIDWPSSHHRRTKPIPEPICWLGWRGVLYLACNSGAKVEPPNRINENQLRVLQRRLREQGFSWLREPRWQQLEHDLAVVDFRMSAERSITEVPEMVLEEWIHESEFRSDSDEIEYVVNARNGKISKKGVCPDSYFVIRNKKLIRAGAPSTARFLLELDNATHPNRRFGLEKVLPGVAYIRSPEYKERFGFNAGRWLVVTTGERRLKNLMQQTKTKAKEDSKLFFFTTIDEAIKNNVLISPIWRQVGDSESKPLIVE